MTAAKSKDTTMQRKLQFLSWACADGRLTRSALAVLVVLTNGANRQHWCCPSVRLLQQCVGVKSCSSIEAALQLLHDTGWIAFQRGSRRRGNQYVVQLDAPPFVPVDRDKDWSPFVPVHRNNGRAAFVPERPELCSSAPTLLFQPADSFVPAHRNLTGVEPVSTGSNTGGREIASARAADALTRTARVASPADSCVEVWQRLQETRPELDFDLIAEAARVHYVEAGLPDKQLTDALRKLAVTPQWHALPTPNGKPKRKPKRSTDEKPTAEQPPTEKAATPPPPAQDQPAPVTSPPAKRTPTKASKAAIAKLQTMKQRTEA